MNLESASNDPDFPLRNEGLDPFQSSHDSHPAKKIEHLSEQEKIKVWARKAVASSSLDVGAIARAEAYLADPNYLDDEVLESVARNMILREGF